MARLIDDLLSLSRVELAEHMHPDTPVDLFPVVRQVVDGLQTLATDRGVEIAIAPPAGAGDRAGRPRRAHPRVREPGGERAQIRRLPASASRSASRRAAASDGAPEILVAVRDYGPGIAAEHLPRLTERFYRVDVTQSRAEGGTGLGLSLVKHILNRHRGKLTIESEAGKGAVFTVRLPLRQVHRVANGADDLSRDCHSSDASASQARH